MYFSRSKIISMFVVCAFGILFALPNLFSKEQVAKWPGFLPHNQINLGLDLKGGAYLLLQLDLGAMRKEQLDTTLDGVRTQLRTDRIGFTSITAATNGFHIALRDTKQLDDAMKSLRKVAGLEDAKDAAFTLTATNDGSAIDGQLTEAALKDRASKAVEQSIEIVRRRIDQLGVAEPQIAKQGDDRILVQLPGVQDPDRVKAIIGTTAKMNFQLVDSDVDPNTTIAPPGDDILPEDTKMAGGAPHNYIVRKKIEVSGGDLTDARAQTDNQSGSWVVSFAFNTTGARRFADTTTANVGKPFAIVLDNKVISAPRINEPITGGRGQISGNYTAQSANDLAVLLRAGALPAPLKIIEERSVGPDLGADSIRAGVIAAGIGLGLVAVYMVLLYGLFGLFADIAVVFNLIITIAVLSLIQATLTLPGIAGLLLSVGMSVDANILVNERIREETHLGRSPFAALEAGYKRAFGTVLDANLTTLIKMAILFMFGAGVVKGFAVTISFGIIISLFTAMILVRWMMVEWLLHTKPKTLLAKV